MLCDPLQLAPDKSGILGCEPVALLCTLKYKYSLGISTANLKIQIGREEKLPILGIA